MQKKKHPEKSNKQKCNLDHIGLVGIHGTSTIVGYSMPNLFYTYKLFYFKYISLP